MSVDLNSRSFKIRAWVGSLIFLIGFALAALMLSVEGILNKEIMREVWHSAFVCLVCYSWYKFPRLGLKYARQYNFARFFLLSTIVFETLAIVANSWMYGL